MLICPSVGKHSRPRRSWGPYVTTGIALEAATIFVDGTKSVTGSYPSEPVPFQLVPPPQRWLPDVVRARCSRFRR
jgi:hypothetical protein